MMHHDAPKALLLRHAAHSAPSFEAIARDIFEVTEAALSHDAVRGTSLNAFDVIFALVRDHNDLEGEVEKCCLELMNHPAIAVTTQPLSSVDAAPFLNLGFTDVLAEDLSPQLVLHRMRQFANMGRIHREMAHLKRKAEYAEERYEKLFKYSLNAIAHYGPTGVPIRTNEAWRKLWGISTKEDLEYFYKQYNLIEDKQLEAKGILRFLRKSCAGQAVALPTILYHGTTNKPEPTYFSRWVEAFSYPNIGDDGKIASITVLQLDVTENIHSEQTLKLLAETSRLLTTSLDLHQTMETIAELAVRDIGDICSISLTGQEQSPQDLIILKKPHASSQQESDLIQNLVPRLHAYFAPHGNGTAVEDYLYAPFLHREDNLPTDEGIRETLLELLGLGIKSFLAVPIKKNDVVLGLVCVLASSRCFNEKDLELLTEISRRAAFAVNNAKLYAEAKEAIQLRDDFIAAASHELRTPMAALLLHNELLQRILSQGSSPPLEELRAMTLTSERHIMNLNVTIESLLDATRLASGKIAIHPERIELTSFIKSIIDKRAFQIHQAKCELTFEAPDPVYGEWDALRLEQIFTNLLSNALKYGAGGLINVQISGGGGQAVIKVRDRGLGIAERDFERIFKPYERSVPIRQYRGLGLGLYITLHMVKLHHGTIEVASKLGEGSTFCVRLPLHQGVLLTDEQQAS